MGSISLQSIYHHKIKIEVYIYPIILLLILVPLTVLKISGTSIGMYNLIFYGKDYKDPNLIFGQPRGIRSDEWMVETPWTISQSQVNYNPNNSLYLAGQNLTTIDAPVANWTLIFRPQFWPMFILPIENAFALKWWLRSVILLISAYSLLMIITQKNILISVLGSLIFLSSAYFQWWYSTIIIEVTGFGLIILYIFINIINVNHIKQQIIYSILLSYFMVCYLILFYPPFQISEALIIAFIGIGYFAYKSRQLTHNKIKNIIVMAGISIIMVLIIAAIYYIDMKDIIKTVENTVYPGHRITIGGGVTIIQLLSGFFDSQLLRDTNIVPSILNYNQSEAASYFMFSIFILPVLLYTIVKNYLNKKDINAVLIFGIVIFVIVLWWMMAGLPKPIATILLLDYVPAQRMWPALGLANFYFIFYYLFENDIHITKRFTIASALYSVIIFGIILSLGIYYKTHYPNYLSNDIKILIIAIIVSTIVYALMTKRKYSFAIILLIFSIITTYKVNPLYKGLSPIINSDLSRAIQKIDNNNAGKEVWASYVSMIFGNYLPANGAESLSGTYYSPNLSFWRELDKNGNNSDIYNRYSHVTIESINNESRILFTLVSTDVVKININPCNKELLKLGINYYLINGKDNSVCLKEIDEINYPNMNFTIYERK